MLNKITTFFKWISIFGLSLFVYTLIQEEIHFLPELSIDDGFAMIYIIFIFPITFILLIINSLRKVFSKKKEMSQANGVQDAAQTITVEEVTTIDRIMFFCPIIFPLIVVFVVTILSGASPVSILFNFLIEEFFFFTLPVIVVILANNFAKKPYKNYINLLMMSVQIVGFIFSLS